MEIDSAAFPRICGILWRPGYLRQVLKVCKPVSFGGGKCVDSEEDKGIGTPSDPQPRAG